MKSQKDDLLLGKLPPDALQADVLRYCGAKRADVLVGAALGEDAALMRWQGQPFLVAASDPVVGATTGAGRLLVHINANDVACKGGDPSWFLVTLIVPTQEGPSLIRHLMQEIHETCLELGVAVVGGHTELTDRYDRPVISGTMLGPARCALSSDKIRSGDLLLATGHAGMEGMSILAHDRPDLLASLAPDELDEVRDWQNALSVIKPAQLLRPFARYMHDPTEGGLHGALLEIRRACEPGIRIDVDAVPISPLTKRVAQELGFDPLHLISSGMLLAVLPPEQADEAQRTLEEEGVASS
ncbi:MAG: hydrogenase expression protein, partial [Fretibacterium sp.]|nr:hydrogenase expression protein [Fretibacterium sp.]